MLSGGIDSATALALACQGDGHASALFIDFGQAAADAEAAAAVAVAAHYGVPLRALECKGLHFSAGEIRGRNAMLAHLALIAHPGESGLVIIGVHAGTKYRDCSPVFVTVVQQSYDFHTDGRLIISAPFVGHEKSGIFDLARQIGVPLALTYSCEDGNVACGRCLSCRDREALLARA